MLMVWHMVNLGTWLWDTLRTRKGEIVGLFCEILDK